MQRLEIASAPARPPAASARSVQDFVRHWLTFRRGLIIGGIVIVAAGTALGWSWLTAIGVAPIILSLAPCAAMCAIGACAMMRDNSSGAKPDSANPVTPPASTPTQSGGGES